jgi:hypothetical protein
LYLTFLNTTATFEVKRGNQNYIKKQNELQKEIEKANEELQYPDQLKDKFINVAAHELRILYNQYLDFRNYSELKK